jgi:hypothetical protein
MPIVREEVYKYVELWNVHNIRKQLNQPNAVTKKPKFNYTYPKTSTIHYRRPIDPEISDSISQEYAEWGSFFSLLFPLSFFNICIVQLMLIIDINEFLPNETLMWISQQLERVDIDLPNLQGADLLVDGSRLHFQVYLQL